tara:strand:+ start:2884 stop:3231 length:348 start_codon:yes stop_codon:yes gene_type:complete
MNEKDLKRFWNKVDKSPGLGNGECWEWISCKTKGYGMFRLNEKTEQAHRLSYYINNGDIPKGLQVHHACDNRMCVNPNHLWTGTKKDNSDDKVKKGRQAKGESLPQSKLKKNRNL